MSSAPPPRYSLAWLSWRAGRSLRNVGLVVVGGGTLAAWVASQRRARALSLPADGFLLELDLEEQGVAEHPSGKGLQALLLREGRPPLQLSSVVQTLTAAGEDYRCKGLLALLGSQPMGIGQLQELRGAVAAFKERAGGRAVTAAYADAFGEGGGGTGAYYLATAFDLIFLAVSAWLLCWACVGAAMLVAASLPSPAPAADCAPRSPSLPRRAAPRTQGQPCSMLSVTGLAVQGVYARGLLDRWRIRPAFFQREQYKSAASFMQNRAATPAEREATISVLGSLSGQVVRGIAEGRRLTEREASRGRLGG